MINPESQLNNLRGFINYCFAIRFAEDSFVNIYSKNLTLWGHTI